LTILVLDQRGGHSANGLVLPAHVRRVWLPPASPERTPIDRVWRDRKDAIAWQQFIDLEAQQE
jgi:transposase